LKKSIGFYLQNIFFQPKAAAEAITQESALLPDPESVYQFAVTGINHNPYQPGEILMVWLIQQTYFYIAMAWQGIVTVIGLSVIHRIRWYWTIPGLIAGDVIFFGFLILIHDHVALII